MFALFWTSTLTGAKGNGKFVFNARKEALDFINYIVPKEYQPPILYIFHCVGQRDCLIIIL